MPSFLQRIFPNITWKGKNFKSIYLTFDDGPDASSTEVVLEILRDKGVKAVFFCLGSKIADYPDQFKRIIQEGHVVGNHGYKHLNGWKTNTKKYFQSAKDCQQLIGNHSQLFRPPYGRLTPSQYMKLKKNWLCVMWSLMPGDFDKKLSAQDCLDILMKKTKGGDIVVLHDQADTIEKIKQILPKYIDHCRSKGYEFSLI